MLSEIGAASIVVVMQMWKQVPVKCYGDQVVWRAFAGQWRCEWSVWVTSKRRRACMHECWFRILKRDSSDEDVLQQSEDLADKTAQSYDKL